MPFLQNIHVYGAIHTILFAWTGRTRGQPIADGASLFEEVYEKSDADFSLEECQILRLIGLGNLQRVHGNLGSDTRACNEVLDVL